MSQQPRVGVGVVCLRGDEVLLIQRGRPPRRGEWSLPGGRLKWGETLAACALRELTEETEVEAELTGLIDVVDGVFAGENGEILHHYVLIDYLAEWIAGEPKAGDDAADARFVSVDAALDLVSWAETRRIIRDAVRMRGGGGQGGAPQTLA